MTEAELDRNTWPELIYRFAEHYKWEPQHLRGTVDEFHNRIRALEVPLNFILNIFLRLSPAEVISNILQQFGLDPNDKYLFEGRYEYPLQTNFTQPDILIETVAARVYIEMKIDAPIKIDQVQKYMLLHAEMDTVAPVKRPYLLFLTRDEFRKCWRPSGEALSISNVGEFLERKLNDLPISDRLAAKIRKPETIERYEQVKKNIRFGAATWSSVGNCLEMIRNNACAGSTEFHLIDDVVSDLRRRGFFTPPSPPVTS